MEQIQVDYYQGAYGKTIRIAVHKLQKLIFLKKLFIHMSSENGFEVEMADLENVVMTDLRSLRLRQTSAEYALGRNLIMEASNDFIWSRSREGWSECADLVDGLITLGTSGHQYLTAENYDDAIIVLSFNEPNGI